MAQFEAHNRLEWDMTIHVNDGASVVTVCDDGWKLWLKVEGKTLFTIATDYMSNRQPNREQAMNIIDNHCGWWTVRRDMFKVHPLFAGQTSHTKGATNV